MASCLCPYQDYRAPASAVASAAVLAFALAADVRVSAAVAVEHEVPVQVVLALQHARLAALAACVQPVSAVHAAAAVVAFALAVGARVLAAVAVEPEVPVRVVLAPVVLALLHARPGLAVVAVVLACAAPAERVVLHVVPDRDFSVAQQPAVAAAVAAVARAPVPVEQFAAVAHRVLCARHVPGTSVPSHDRARCLPASSSRDRGGRTVIPAFCSSLRSCR